MHQDLDLNDQKLKPDAQDPPNVDLDFISALNDRQVGFTKKKTISSKQISVSAEDELVKKQFKEKHCELPGVPRSTFLMEFSPDGTKVASTHGNHQIYVTDVRTGKHIKTLIGHPRTPWCIAFHPTSNQIIASGCLGGQVRIWDLSGGSEVWISENPSVIASIAFHPDDRLLVIATLNELYLWDWSKPEPSIRLTTASVKEKVRYVAFDALGHKLITGITNTPQTRWERVGPVPVSVSMPVPSETRPPGPCPRRITRRIVAPRFNWPTPNNNSNSSNNNNNGSFNAEPLVSSASNTTSEPLSSVPARERRITSCYRELVHQYEVLVHRYLQVYRRPIMIDQGTDPMEIESNNQATTSQSTSTNRPDSPIPSTSGIQRPPRKSSAAHPPKNRHRRLLFQSESSGSSSSGSSPEDNKSKASGSTQTGNAQAPGPTNEIKSKPSYSSSSSDDDDTDHWKKINKLVVLSEKGTLSSQCNDNKEEADDTLTKPEVTPSTGVCKIDSDSNMAINDTSTLRQFTAARQLRLKKTPTMEEQEEVMSEECAEDSEPKTKVRIKCVADSKSPSATRTATCEHVSITTTASSSNTISTSSTTLPQTTTATSTTATPAEEGALSTRNAAQNINFLINNAKFLLSRYRETLQQRGLQVRGVDIPELPTTSAMPQAGPSNKPSKGTNTNEIEAPPKRKRRLLRPNLLGNILFTSSDDSSSDEVPEAPIRPFIPSTITNENFNVDAEQGAAGSTSTNSNIDSRMNRKRRVPGVDLELLQASSHESSTPLTAASTNTHSARRKKLNLAIQDNSVSTPPGASAPTSVVCTEPSTSTTSNTQTESLMDRQMQRLVVESLSVLDGPSASETTTLTNSTLTNSRTNRVNRGDQRVCSTCNGIIVDNNDNRHADGCARTAPVFPRHQQAGSSSNTGTSANVPPTTPPLDRARRRFLSHRLSAFYPTRLLSRMLRDRPGASSTSRGRESPLPSNYPQDEVINFSERDGEEATPSSTSTRSYHPFDPPPDIMSINPENIGIGNMYSTIVAELESSLNDVRNIRFRLGEMSDMLSNFSDRLENIMTQSNTILRNLSNSLEDLPATESEPIPLYEPLTHRRPPNSAHPLNLDDLMQSWVRTLQTSYIPSRLSTPVNSDHTYPINPDATQNSTISPLHLSLQLTVIHIQRQARLLRQQVESIERIDRAMIEVAQLQMMRQMFDELHVHFGANNAASGVSSVRQMMAGTRISDSSPYDSPSDEGNNNNNNNNNGNNDNAETRRNDTAESLPSASGSTTAVGSSVPSTSHAPTPGGSGHPNRARVRKNYPRCLFLMHRQCRRSANSGLAARRNAAKDRILFRRNIYRRLLPSRTQQRATLDLFNLRSRDLLNPDTLPSMTRRIEHYLMEHCRYIGRSVIPPTSGSNTRSDMGEHVMTIRLSYCRMRMNRLMGNFQVENENASVTADGTSRFAARQALSYILHTLTRFVEVNPSANISSSTFRSQIWEVIELSLLLSELLLLQIVDSIPPPSGMNLDPERENLSMRIDQMCTRMLQSRLMGQSNQLTRSLRLMRLTVRHATHALGQTYTQRRNAMLPANNDNDRGDSRQGLLDDIHNCLRNIRRYRELTSDRPDDDLNFGYWYRTINDLISRYTSTGNNDSPVTSSFTQRQESNNASLLNNETGEEIRPPTVTVEDANSSDDNSNNNDVMFMMRPHVGLYQLPRPPQAEDNDEDRPWRMNVPTVQVNDVPVPDTSFSSMVRNQRQRLRISERLHELRTAGLLRPRFLHPLYSGVVNSFAFDDFDEAHREPLYDSDVIPTVTPNHRIQVWEFSQAKIPNISNSQKNLVVSECKIHNDASVDYASDGSILVTLLPSGGYMNLTNRLGVYSLQWQTLGQCLYVTSFEQNAVSVSLSPTNRHLLVGLASRRVSIQPTETWTMARIFLLDYQSTTHGNLAPIRELEQNRDSNFMSLNCIRWLPTGGQGLIYGTNTGHLRLLT